MTHRIIVLTIIPHEDCFRPKQGCCQYCKAWYIASRCSKYGVGYALGHPRYQARYGEVRMIGFAYIGLRLCCVVYTGRGDERRIISLRKANKREVTRYAET